MSILFLIVFPEIILNRRVCFCSIQAVQSQQSGSNLSWSTHDDSHICTLHAETRLLQWKRSVTLDDIVKLLGDVKGFVDIPHQVRAAQEAKVSS